MAFALSELARSLALKKISIQHTSAECFKYSQAPVQRFAEIKKLALQ